MKSLTGTHRMWRSSFQMPLTLLDLGRRIPVRLEHDIQNRSWSLGGKIVLVIIWRTADVYFSGVRQIFSPYPTPSASIYTRKATTRSNLCMLISVDSSHWTVLTSGQRHRPTTLRRFILFPAHARPRHASPRADLPIISFPDVSAAT